MEGSAASPSPSIASDAWLDQFPTNGEVYRMQRPALMHAEQSLMPGSQKFPSVSMLGVPPTQMTVPDPGPKMMLYLTFPFDDAWPSPTEIAKAPVPLMTFL